MMNGDVEHIKELEVRSTGSPVRVKADPSLVSDVVIGCSTPTSLEDSRRRYQEDLRAWESIADLPSDDEYGESFDKTVASLLIGMNMGQYLALFRSEDIGLNMFLTLTEDDLKAIGIDDKTHQKEMAYSISNIRKKRDARTIVRGVRDDATDATLSIQETIPVMCHTVKHINNLVILLRNYRSRLNAKSVQNQVLDPHHSAALGAAILTKEALAQAELLKVQLRGMLVKLDPLRPEKSRSQKSKTQPSKNSNDRGMFRAALLSAGLTILLALILRKHSM